MNKAARQVVMEVRTEQTLFQKVGIKLGEKVLDVGFRSVEELQEIASLVGPTGSVYGMDIDPLNVQSASQMLSQLPSSDNVHVKVGSVLAIPFDDRSFDLVLCKGVLHEVKQLKKAVAEMSRVCKPNGTLTIIDLQRFSRLKFQLYRFHARLSRHKPDDVHPGLTREQLLELLVNEHFEELQYQQLPVKGRLGFIEAPLFLLKAKRTK